MQRSSVVFLSALSLLVACGDSTPAPQPPPPPPPPAPVVTAPPVDTSAVDAGAAVATPPATPALSMPQAIDALNADLYTHLKVNKGNLLFSPASIELALAMAAGGARGETATQMQSTLHLGSDPVATNQAASALLGSWSQKSGKGPTLDVANRLWGQQGYAFLPEFLTTTKAAYGAELAALDFKKSADASRKTINTWVSDQTNHKINDLLPQGSVGPTTRLVLTNAVYFKGAWRTPFDKKKTNGGTFVLSTGGKVTASQMHATLNEAQYADAGDFEVLSIPYAGDAQHRLSMLIALPKAGKTLDVVEAALDPTSVSKWVAAEHAARVDLTLPRFKTSGKFALESTLGKLGMPDAFTDSADFSGIAQKGADPLKISAVLHKAYVEVNEEGTEAAAATGVVMTTKAVIVAPKTVDFKVDHPFLFFIRDDASGTVLFTGRIEDPTQKGT